MWLLGLIRTMRSSDTKVNVFHAKTNKADMAPLSLPVVVLTLVTKSFRC